MQGSYNQIRAMLAVTKASLKATFRSPQSVFFGLFFPIVLIWIFGSLSGNGAASVDVAFERNMDTTNIVYQEVKNYRGFHFIDTNKKDAEDELKKGRIAAIIGINRSTVDTAAPYAIQLRTSSASQKDMPFVFSGVKTAANDVDQKMNPNLKSVASINTVVSYNARPYRMIDFFLPGMIGFSLIGSAVFGVAFLFFSLRETLVLKRMYSTPIQRQYIILGESLSKVIFNLMTVAVLIGFGVYSYHFTLAHGIITFIDMLILSFLALLVFMGFGFFISGVSKTQNVIPIYANLFMFPQYFLSGTFFPRSALPAFLQPFIQFLPLTAVNDAMRNISFEGSSLFSCWPQLLILVVWGLIIYIITAKVFRWE